jgi:hypothetical protein
MWYCFTLSDWCFTVGGDEHSGIICRYQNVKEEVDVVTLEDETTTASKHQAPITQ